MDYEEFVAPYVEKIFKAVDSDHPQTPKIHFGINTPTFVKTNERKELRGCIQHRLAYFC
jgi:uroporphyrinogen-III decarboxylase